MIEKFKDELKEKRYRFNVGLLLGMSPNKQLVTDLTFCFISLMLIHLLFIVMVL